MTVRPVAAWLWCCCGLVFALVVLGGAVRLTGAGLSIVDWRPLGILPPLDTDAWARAFADYQRFPEFRLRNPDMTLAHFQFIYWMEYAHRLLARVTGIAFIAPFLFFAWRKMLSRTVIPGLCILLLLGGAQGLLGWWMVQSGLVDRPEVSHYRLLAHFMLAVVIYVLLLRYAIVVSGFDVARKKLGTVTRWDFGTVTLTVLLLMLASGALVAGTDAGKMFNTYPMMGDTFLPPQLFALRPWWNNFLDNPITIQLTHRCLAAVVAITVTCYAIQLIRAHRWRVAYALLITVTTQLALGIATLLTAVPTPLAIAHQATAMALLTTVVFATVTVGDRHP